MSDKISNFWIKNTRRLKKNKDEEIKVKFISWAKYADKWVNEIDEEK